MNVPDWQPWDLNNFRGSTVGGHSFCLYPNATTDHRRKAEKAWHATGKCQVVHYHPEGENCLDRCEVFGINCPQTIDPPKTGEI